MGNFRAIRGKGANMYYMFKSDARRHSLQASNSILKIFWVLAVIALIAGVALFAGSLALWFLVLILFSWWLPQALDSWMPDLMDFAGKMTLVALIALAVFAVVYLIKFAIEWIAVLHECHELKKDGAANKIYLDISGAVKIVKLCNLAAFILVAGLMTALSFMIKGNGADQDSTLSVIFVVVTIVVLIANKIVSVKQFQRVQPQIDTVKAARGELKEARKEEQSAKKNK
ncbi:hypothetical protein FACS1894211_09590 [Clostridia bacterium]|nr:hypothetical protein FACS1894211_09590 [Clostridia bacterium]